MILIFYQQTTVKMLLYLLINIYTQYPNFLLATDQPSGFNVKAPTGDDLLKSHTGKILYGTI